MRRSQLSNVLLLPFFAVTTIVADWYKERRKTKIRWKNCDDPYKMYMHFDISHGQCTKKVVSILNGVFVLLCFDCFWYKMFSFVHNVRNTAALNGKRAAMDSTLVWMLFYIHLWCLQHYMQWCTKKIVSRAHTTKTMVFVKGSSVGHNERLRNIQSHRFKSAKL